MQKQSSKNEIFYLDFLRTLATIMVVTMHVGSGSETYIDMVTRKFASSIASFCVPMFFLITGVLYLGVKREIDFRKHMKKTLKLLALTLLWAFLYNTIAMMLVDGINKIGGVLIRSLTHTISANTEYCYHLWYLYALVGIYLLLPYLNIVVGTCSNEEKTILLILSICIAVVIPTVQKGLYGIEKELWYGGFVYYTGFIVYILLGGLLYNIKIAKWMRCIAGTIIMIIVGLFFYIAEIDFEGTYSYLSEYLSVPTCLLTISIFILFKDCNIENVFVRERIKIISENSFAIYLLQVMCIMGLRKIFHIESNIAPLYITLPIITIMTVLICFFSGGFMKKVPIIKKMVML